MNDRTNETRNQSVNQSLIALQKQLTGYKKAVKTVVKTSNQTKEIGFAYDSLQN